MERLFEIRQVRFLAGSVLCTLINNLILIGGDHLGYGYISLTFAAYMCSATAGYIFHSVVTFESLMSIRGYLSFTAGIWLGLPLALLILGILTSGIALPMSVAAPAMTVLMFAYHYLIARWSITRLGVSSGDAPKSFPPH